MIVSEASVAKLRESAQCSRFCGLSIMQSETHPTYEVAHNTISFGVAVAIDRSEYQKDSTEKALTEWLVEHHRYNPKATLGIAHRETVRA